MRVELYNDKWLQSSGTRLPTRSAHIDLPSNKLDDIAFTPSTIPTVKDLLINSNILPVIETIADPLLLLLDSADLHESILRSKDKLLFIKYTPAGILLHCWFLIQLDLESSVSLHSDYAIRSLYYCIFLAKYPNDKRLSDEFRRCWPDLYKYSRDSVSNDLVFGDIILFRLNVIPDITKYIQWAAEIILRPAFNILFGLFDFESISSPKTLS